MFINVELEVNHKLLRGDVRLPEGTGPFPVVCFYHGFCVDRIGQMRLHELFARKCAVNGIACVKFDFYGCGESDGDFSEMRYMDEVEPVSYTHLSWFTTNLDRQNNRNTDRFKQTYRYLKERGIKP